MNIRKALTPETVVLGLKSATKDEVIEELLDHLIAAGRVRADRRAMVLDALMARERKMSTGMQHGIAIPHCKTDAVDELVATLAISREGIDFNSLDGQPSRIFVMTVSPLSRTGPHIQFLAEISRLLNDQGVQDRLLKAEKKDEVLDVF